jgi:release factor glutamine methyltransferase
MIISELLHIARDVEGGELIVRHVLGLSPTELLQRENNLVSETDVVAIKALLTRREAGEPVAYIIGEKDFFGRSFLVTPDVLIPRPESEWLVEQVLQFAAQKQTPITIIDVGTGSGCLAVSVAKELEQRDLAYSVTGTDVSPAALAVAQKNAERLNAQYISFQNNNLLEGLKTFDIIIANLPYVPVSDYQKLYGNLRFEPELALTDNTDHFVLLERFLQQLPKHLNAHGLALLETDPASYEILTPVLVGLSQQYNWTITWHKDLHGLWRYIRITA